MTSRKGREVWEELINVSETKCLHVKERTEEAQVKENMSCCRQGMGQNTDKVVLLRRNENKDVFHHGK